MKTLGLSSLAFITLALGCDGRALEEDDGGGSTGPVGSHEEVIEVFSWWTSGGESEALDAMLTVHSEAHPEATVINAAVSGDGGDAREVLAERVSNELYPDTFQASFGRDLISNWITREGGSILSPIDDLAAEEGWSEVFPAGLLEAVSHEGQLYAVPVNIHRTNVMFYNMAVFDDNGLEVPTTLEGLFDLGDTLLALDEPITPIAVGSNGAWTLSLFTFENLFVSHAGIDGYVDFFSGNTSGSDYPPLIDTLEDLLRLTQYFNDNRDQLEWDQAVGLVERGQASLNVMGDWAKGNLESRGAVPGEDFGAAPFPGTSDAFIFTGDCFPLVEGAPNQAATLELLRTFGSREGQDAFNPIKGSIPARSDADLSLYDSVATQTIEDFGEATTAPGLAAFIPPAMGSALVDAIPGMLLEEDIQVMLDVVDDHYDSLSE